MNPTQARTTAVAFNFNERLTDAEIILAATNMKTFGGHFAAAIGDALLYADSDNKRRLVEAFPGLIEKYSSSVWKV